MNHISALVCVSLFVPLLNAVRRASTLARPPKVRSAGVCSARCAMCRRALLLAALAALLAARCAGGAAEERASPHLPRGHEWNYTLLPHMLARSIGYEGSSDALRRMVAKLDAGGSAVVSVLGGSVSRGHGGPSGAGDHNAGHPGSWSRLIYDYINVRWPGRRHIYANGAIAATGSPYFAQCLGRHLHKEADLVLLEFAVNDGHGNQGTVASVETIVRRVTRERGGFGARPAMALVHWYDRWPGREEGRESRNSSRAAWHPEWATSVEGMLGPLAQYYDIASISMRNALLYEDLRVVSGFAFDDFSNNWNHPNERGHRMMADAVIYLIARVADGMARERAGLRVAEAHARTHNGSVGAHPWAGGAVHPPPPPPGGDELWLPQPLVEGNDSESREPVCSFGEELHHLVRSAKGFTYVEDAEKPGWMSNSTGAVLELDVGQTFQAITLSYLRSWRPGMGQGTVTCVDGCSCEEQKIDARSKADVSVMVQHHFGVSAAPKCTLRVEAGELPPLPGRPPSVGPGATFKVMGVTVTGLKVAPHSGALGGEMPLATLHGISAFDPSKSPPPPAAPVPRAPPVRTHPARDVAPAEQATPPGLQDAAQQANVTAGAPAPPPPPEPPLAPALDALPAR